MHIYHDAYINHSTHDWFNVCNFDCVEDISRSMLIQPPVRTTQLTEHCQNKPLMHLGSGMLAYLHLLGTQLHLQLWARHADSRSIHQVGTVLQL